MGKQNENYKTYKNVFDQFTLRNLFKLSSQNIIEELQSPLAIGKEANIFIASTDTGENVVVKIYRLETCDFNRMFDYMKYDTRYTNLKLGKRDVIFSWAQREFRNIVKARDAGVKTPLPIKCLYNINVMELIGKTEPAPKIKHSFPEDKKAAEEFCERTFEYMKKLHDVGLVHGDLSEYNILNLNDKPVFIDFSQSTPMKSSNANELLERDIRNMCRFFTKNGMKYDVEERKRFITGITD